MERRIWEDGESTATAGEVLHLAYLEWRREEPPLTEDDVTFGHFALRRLAERGYRVVADEAT